jgi:diadenosine tetraphosphate (Ap4A) HIT family hydrolase
MKLISNFEQKIAVLENSSAKCFFDKYPVNKGHMLVVPNKKVKSIYDLSKKDYQQIFDLVLQCRKYLKNKFKVNNFNVGINDGKLAGQTVNQAHIHIIPRYKGDVKDPAGGIRGVIPKKRKYK